MYLVLISRHFYDDDFTTQFRYNCNSDSIGGARVLARTIFPSIYYIHPEVNRLVAYFTGAIYGR